MVDTTKAISWKVENLKIPLLVLLLPLISSCMHMGMMGESSSHQSPDDSLFEKEVTVGGVRLSAIIPHLEVGRRSELTVRLSDDSSGRLLSNAMIQLSIKRDDDTASIEDGEHLTFEESQEAGAYTVQYDATRSGLHTFRFSITEIEGRRMNPPVIVEAERVVGEGMHEHSGGMHGMGGTATRR
ncbi:MAG: hypothetical protein HW389_3389 [Bacteroidetes bacterium]|nr:hypothetical protein [Bacteroidota bacterium]